MKRFSGWIFLLVLSSAACLHAQELRWETKPGFRVASLAVPAGGKPGFTLLSGAETGLVFTNQLGWDAEAQNQNLLNGSGVALGDYDNDGRCDIFLCNLNGSCALFRNLGGWKFTNVTVQAGLANTNWLARGAVFADVNGDGNLDLLLTRSGHGAMLFLNNGHGGFVQAQEPELVAETGSTSLALADIDGDGALDLYVANYGENTIRSGMKMSTKMVGGREQVVGRMRNRLKIINGHLLEYGEPDVLYRNDGHGHFQRVSWTDGTFRDESGEPLKAPPWDLGLTVVMRDINQDGFPDIYVCNDFQDPDRLWLNNGHGQFQAIRREAMRLSSQFSMGVDFADINNDGYDDFFVSDMLSANHALRMRQLDAEAPPLEYTLEKALDRPQFHRNTFFLNRGDGTYAEIANFAGLATSDWTWTVCFMDVDLDGWQDILVGNGHYYDTLDLDAVERSKAFSPLERKDPRKMLSLFPPLRTPNVAYRNRGDLTFEEVGQAWGFNSLQGSHSMAFADLDNDGDLDVIINCVNAQTLIYRNNSSAPRIAVTLRGTAPNTRGIGARVKVLGGAVPMQSQEMICGGRYLAGDAPMRVFAAGTLTNDLTIEVTWRSGKQSRVEHAQPNHIYELDEAAAQVAPKPPAKPARPTPLFQDVGSTLSYRHEEDAFDEYARQPLLPHPLGQLGPGLAWVDLDGDGREDLVVGAARGSRLGVFHNDGDGKFSSWREASANPLPDDSTGMAVIPSAKAGGTALMIGLANYESGQTNAAFQLFADSGKISAGNRVPGLPSSAGPLAAADLDGSGRLSLFVGGRSLPGHYPEAASSALFRAERGAFVLDKAASKQLDKLGLVSGAVFTDLDGDGKPELVLACEWGPVRVFARQAGTWRETTQKWGLDKLPGLWRSITAADVDGDGRMDLIAGNVGLNSAYEQVTPGPWELYYGDLNEDGSVQILEAFQEHGQVLPWRQMVFLERALPWLRGKYPTNRAYSEATLPQILSGRPGSVQQLVARHLGSAVFLNRGDHFEVKPLPSEAQWAPVFGIAVADFDGDGNEDLFLAQNDYAVRPEDPRMDGGRGLLLRGDGRGSFTPMPGESSGIIIYGEQRGCAVADYDGDGRPDLAVAERNGPLHLFHNITGAPGLRVRLQGPPGNPDGVGAILRLHFSDRVGPARELHSGSGYWSQDGMHTILATPSAPRELEVRWPGGKTTKTPVPANARSITLNQADAVR